MNHNVVIFAKEPWSGRVKTRLGRDYGYGAAAAWFRLQVLSMIRELEKDPRLTLWLAVTPDKTGLLSRVWPAHIPKIPQGRGDLGQRMNRVFHALPAGPAVIIGGDTPMVKPIHLHKAFAALGNHQAVFGPAEDGGYWLIGLQTGFRPAKIFNQVAWSSETALADTVASLKGASIGYTDCLRDVDTLADLHALNAKKALQEHHRLIHFKQ